MALDLRIGNRDFCATSEREHWTLVEANIERMPAGLGSLTFQGRRTDIYLQEF
jgi:hypothetical protein